MCTCLFLLTLWEQYCKCRINWKHTLWSILNFLKVVGVSPSPPKHLFFCTGLDTARWLDRVPICCTRHVGFCVPNCVLPVFRKFGMFRLWSDGIMFDNTFNYSFRSIKPSLCVGRAVGYIQYRQERGGGTGTNYGVPQVDRGLLCYICFFYFSVV